MFIKLKVCKIPFNFPVVSQEAFHQVKRIQHLHTENFMENFLLSSDQNKQIIQDKWYTLAVLILHLMACLVGLLRKINVLSAMDHGQCLQRQNAFHLNLCQNTLLLIHCLRNYRYASPPEWTEYQRRAGNLCICTFCTIFRIHGRWRLRLYLLIHLFCCPSYELVREAYLNTISGTILPSQNLFLKLVVVFFFVYRSTKC